MAGILLIAHAPLATALQKLAAHAFQEAAAGVVAFDVEPDQPLDQIEAQARRALASLGTAEVLILTDVFGATPCNVAQRLAAQSEAGQVKVVTGVNVPMLWKSLTYAAQPLETLVTYAIAGATQGVTQAATSRPQNQAFIPGAHAQENHHHQQ